MIMFMFNLYILYLKFIKKANKVTESNNTRFFQQKNKNMEQQSM